MILIFIMREIIFREKEKKMDEEKGMKSTKEKGSD